MTDRPDTPPLVYGARLDELEGCWLEFRCGTCPPHHHPGRQAPGAALWRASSLGRAIVSRVVCKQCRTKPAEIHLNETHNRLPCHGTAPGWSGAAMAPRRPLKPDSRPVNICGARHNAQAKQAHSRNRDDDTNEFADRRAGKSRTRRTIFFR